MSSSEAEVAIAWADPGTGKIVEMIMDSWVGGEGQGADAYVGKKCGGETKCPATWTISNRGYERAYEAMWPACGGCPEKDPETGQDNFACRPICEGEDERYDYASKKCVDDE